MADKQDPDGYHIYFTDDVPEDVFVDEVEEVTLPVDDSQPGDPTTWGPHPPFRKPTESSEADQAEEEEVKGKKAKKEKKALKNVKSATKAIPAEATEISPEGPIRQDVEEEKAPQAKTPDAAPKKGGTKQKKRVDGENGAEEVGKKRSLFSRLFRRG